MNKQEIKLQFHRYMISFDFAVSQLMKLGFTEFAAEQFLYAE